MTEFRLSSDTKCLTHIALFAGIGGDSLAAEWAGFRHILFCELDSFCQKVLRKHWPSVPIIGDIHELTKQRFRQLTGLETVTLITGGDPCQPRSVAGKRRGKADDRDLWSEMFRIICELKPTWVINENPTGRLSMDFHEVLSDLESAGYETRSFVIPACAVNAPHRRDRLFIVAHFNSRRLGRCHPDRELDNHQKHDDSPKKQGWQNHTQSGIETNDKISSPAANLHSQRLAEWGKQDLLAQRSAPERTYWQDAWIEVATSLCGVDDGLPHRVDRLKALGNAIVPQQIYPILKAIARIENYEH